MVDSTDKDKILYCAFNQDQGCFSVGTERGFGYIDGGGEMVIPAKYSSAGRFSEGLAPVGLGGNGRRWECGELDNRRRALLVSRTLGEVVGRVHLDGADLLCLVHHKRLALCRQHSCSGFD